MPYRRAALTNNKANHEYRCAHDKAFVPTLPTLIVAIVSIAAMKYDLYSIFETLF